MITAAVPGPAVVLQLTVAAVVDIKLVAKRLPAPNSSGSRTATPLVP